MYGDTSVIRRLAATMGERAEAVRREADDLVLAAQETAWSGWAAEALRARVADQATTLRRTADRHDRAARALVVHAEEVDRLEAVIAAIEHRAHELIDAARDRLSGLAHALGAALPDPVDELLSRFVPPSHGSRDWLSVDLPGLS